MERNGDIARGRRRWHPDTPGKVIRQGRLFDNNSGRSVIVAIDHAVDHGMIKGLENMEAMVGAMMDCPPDGLLLRPATLKRYASLLARRGGPALIAALDSRMTASVPGGDTIGEEHVLIAKVEQAVALGADAVKILLIFGRRDLHVHALNLKRVARVIAEADKLGVPVMVETVLWGLGIPRDKRHDPALIPHICRIGAELGADIVKAPYAPGVYRDLTANLPVPIVVLGGGLTDEVAVYGMVSEAMDEGAAGVAIGRNVFQAESPARVLRRLHEIVHGAHRTTGDEVDERHVGGGIV